MFKKIGRIYQFLPFLAFGDLVHGFSTREIDSSAFFDELKLGKAKIIGMDQVHGAKVVEVGKDIDGILAGKCDGVLTSKRGIYLFVKTADCLPILLFDKRKKIVGVVHAGWRGTLAEISRKMIGRFIGRGSDVNDIIVGLGPAICVKCYRVDDEQAGSFLDRFKMGVKGNYLDLVKINIKQLTSLGVKKKNIYEAGICTYEADDFFSYRKGDRGEFIGLIGMK